MPGGVLAQEVFEERARRETRLFLELPAEMEWIREAALFRGFLDGASGILLEEHDAFPEFLSQRIFCRRAVKSLREEAIEGGS